MLDNEYKVAVVLLNWRNCEDTLACIASLLDSGIKDRDIIVIDNDSQDNSLDIISKEFPNVILLASGKNGGFAYGCNVGLKYAFAKGYSYFWLLNNDTFVGGNTLISMLKLFNGDNNIGIVGSVIRDAEFPYNIQYIGGGKIDFWLGRVRSYKDIDEINQGIDYITGASMLISREVLDKCGFLDERYFMYWEDVEFCLRAAKNGYNIAIALDSTVLHAESSSLKGMSLTKTAMLNTSQEIFFKQQTIFSPLIIGFNQFGRLVKKILRGDFNNIKEIYIKYEDLR